jgi:3-methylcrotonyl-CoA carboxylase alpha subunit
VRSIWLDRGRVRTVEAVSLGGRRFRVKVDQGVLEVEVEVLGDGFLRLTTAGGGTLAEVTTAGARRFVRLGHLDFVLERASGSAGVRGSRATESRLESPMPGVVTKVLVAPGDDVRKGQPLIAVEAMKMEHLIRAPRDGRVVVLRARVGDMVNGGVPLAEMDGAE